MIDPSKNPVTKQRIMDCLEALELNIERQDYYVKDGVITIGQRFGDERPYLLRKARKIVEQFEGAI